MADLSINFAGITAPNPFWLASAPPTNTGAQIMRAYITAQGWRTLWRLYGLHGLLDLNRKGGWFDEPREVSGRQRLAHGGAGDSRGGARPLPSGVRDEHEDSDCAHRFRRNPRSGMRLCAAEA